jgi:hypothetical protein
MNSEKYILSVINKACLFLILLHLGFLITVFTAGANNLLTPRPANEIPEFKEGAPELAELLPRVIVLSEHRVALEKMLMVLPDMTDVEASLSKIKNHIHAKAEHFEQIKGLRNSALRQSSSINADLQTKTAEFNRIIKQLSNAFAELETNRQYWINEERQWESWQSSLPGDAYIRLGLKPLFVAAQENYRSALDMIAKARKQSLSIQQLVVGIQNDIGALNMNIFRARVQWDWLLPYWPVLWVRSCCPMQFRRC